MAMMMTSVQDSRSTARIRKLTALSDSSFLLANPPGGTGGGLVGPPFAVHLGGEFGFLVQPWTVETTVDGMSVRPAISSTLRSASEVAR